MWMDRVVERVADRISSARLPTPSVALLGEARMQAALDVAARHRDRALELAGAMDRHEPGAAEAYGELAEQALREMREQVIERARSLGAPERLAAEVDARWGNCDLKEYLDDPHFDETARVKIIGHLDAFNVIIGSYRSFFRAMQPLFAEDRPTRVLDLAAGHGGFALEAMRIARRRGIDLEITATDLKPEYLALGERISKREKLGVRFAQQDALDLSNVEVGAYDVIVCTQSLHHFPASMIARMFRESARVAGRGVALIDGCRSAIQGVIVPALGGLRYFDRVFIHDAWVSFRRFYAPEELGLIARLGPEADFVESKWMRPGHCLVRWRR